MIENAPVKRMSLPPGIKSGDVVSICGVDVVKVGSGGVLLHDLLSWDGLEKEMSKCEQIEPEMVHTFSGGVYIREMHLKKGTFIIGKRHRHETCNVLMEGTISVYLGDDKPVSKITGPTIVTSDPMVRKIAYVHEDTVFLNIHPTDKTDLDDIEKEFVVTEEEYKKLNGGDLCLGEL